MNSVTTLGRPFSAKKWNLSGLTGISDATLEMHFGLYEGYVKNTNLLNEHLSEFRGSGKDVGTDPAFSELVRRLGFEYNGMRLHELYFDGLTSKPQPIGGGKLAQLLGETYGSVEEWKKDFAAIADMRGIGWAIAYFDTAAGTIGNYWIGDHENGHIAGAIPVVVLDVWEHAFIKDYKPAEKSRYVEAFFANVDWNACAARLP